MLCPSDPVSAAYLQRQHWFASKTKAVVSVRLRDWAPLRAGRAALSIQEVAFADGGRESYVVPLASGGADISQDALENERFCLELLDAIVESRSLAAGEGIFRFVAMQRIDIMPKNARPMGAQQSNTSIVYDDVLVLKLFRRLAGGVNPELEVGRFLATHGSFRNTPQLVGYVEYERNDGVNESIAVLQRFVPNSGDGWTYLQGHLRRSLDKAGRADFKGRAVADPGMTDLRRLGQLTGELHRALAEDNTDPDFRPEPVWEDDLVVLFKDVVGQIGRTIHLMRTSVHRYPDSVREQLREVVSREESYRGMAGALSALNLAGRLTMIRTHGDYHLGQVLRTPGDFVVTDFEGEPARPLAARRRKQVALRDVAGMLRSLDYAVKAALNEAGDSRGLALWAKEWETEARRSFLDGYLAETLERGASFVPSSEASLAGMLALFELEKAFYELEYEANNRPDWVGIPLRYLMGVP